MGEQTKKEPCDFWHAPAVIALNNFKYKSLSNWACNISVGCSHACQFCYVPSASVNKQGPKLREFQVRDPDAQWGEYSLLRPWHEEKFLASLKKAETTPQANLKPDGNRAVIFCSTTDPYQVFQASSPEKTKLLNDSAKTLVKNALVAIRDHSDLNVRILTRSPLASVHFDLFKSFGIRLVFGMSLPTLDNRLARIYEPQAPSPAKRLETLQAAKAAGLHVFVVMAPTYPECDEADVRKTLAAIKELNPIIIFHEPINIRAENIVRIEKHADGLKPPVKLNTAVFATREAWWEYALNSLLMVQRLATEAGLLDRLHLWPDQQLGSKSCFLQLRKLKRARQNLTRFQEKRHAEQDQKNYDEKYHPWIESWWTRISEWPGPRQMDAASAARKPV